jgi:NADPH:quinone reductase-like Zn-dependent oxidoreductase
MKFKALVIRENGDSFTREITERDSTDLPAGDLLVKVKYSSLNYKAAI